MSNPTKALRSIVFHTTKAFLLTYRWLIGGQHSSVVYPPIIDQLPDADPYAGIARLPENYRMAEIIIEMPDATYQYLSVSRQLRSVRRMAEAPPILQHAALDAVLNYYETRADGLVVQCALKAFPGSDEAMIGVATIRVSRMLLEDTTIFHSIAQMGRTMVEETGISLSHKLIITLCELTDQL